MNTVCRYAKSIHGGKGWRSLILMEVMSVNIYRKPERFLSEPQILLNIKDTPTFSVFPQLFLHHSVWRSVYLYAFQNNLMYLSMNLAIKKQTYPTSLRHNCCTKVQHACFNQYRGVHQWFACLPQVILGGFKPKARFKVVWLCGTLCAYSCQIKSCDSTVEILCLPSKLHLSRGKQLSRGSLMTYGGNSDGF